jgi:hypothetical protein
MTASRTHIWLVGLVAFTGGLLVLNVNVLPSKADVLNPPKLESVVLDSLTIKYPEDRHADSFFVDDQLVVCVNGNLRLRRDRI